MQLGFMIPNAVAVRNLSQSEYQVLSTLITMDPFATAIHPYRMMPPPELFSREVGNIGISNTNAVIVYDRNDLFSSPRAWWMFHAMVTASCCSQRWPLGLEITWWRFRNEKANPPKKKSVFISEPQQKHFVQASVVTEELSNPTTCILDARASERFDAAHMPHAQNQPYQTLIENGYMRPKDELLDLLSKHFMHKKVICSCGSGVTACVLVLGAHVCGFTNVSVYDGSWSEWGSNPSLPKISKAGN